jgi:hypothetical protein
MKKILQKFKDIFTPKELQGLDSMELLAALNDPQSRKIWLFEVYEELKRLNLQIDSKLLSGSEFRLTDLCARRKAYQDVLEGVLFAQRQAKSHNPGDKSRFDFSSATV